MADHDQFNTSNSIWDSSRNRYEAAAPSSSSSSTIHNSGFGWPNEVLDIKARPSMDSASESDNSSVVFHNPQKLQGPDSSSLDFQMIDLGLSSQSMDWNQALLRGEKTETSFRSILQDNMNYQQIHRGFSLDQQINGSSGDQSSTIVACQGMPSSNFQMDSSSIYGSPSTMFQGFLGSDNNQQQHQQSSFENHHHRSMNYQYGVSPNYGMSSTNELVSNSWSKVPQFLRNTTSSPPKQQSPLQFSNNATFWNASASSMTDVRPGFFPALQPQFPTQSFDEKPKNVTHEAGDSSSVVKKSSSESPSKRPRNENSTPLPPFKVRKEKMGDRITALQQLVSPFGKTDTASVLSEAIEYIKFLHEQVLSTPYMKSGAPIHHQQQQQNCDKPKDPEGPKQDLRSRGLCLVPISSTFPVTHETAVDFWTPTFGGTFR
ncbi:transcription factor bHLH123-like isoform X2 [Tripterygium wilfordii]|uniref:transcription factor bHLH123-like isoform X2 n=1 Tax=Tripterygium wilfordii TaxID=458696 RepID=UPI0018F84AB3|nr:transcription factor bHLH123-like isoform X2 [Tripterygium wilfordii]